MGPDFFNRERREPREKMNTEFDFGGEPSPGLSPCNSQTSGSHPDQEETRSLRSLKPARYGRAPLRALAVSKASAYFEGLRKLRKEWLTANLH